MLKKILSAVALAVVMAAAHAGQRDDAGKDGA